MDGTETQTDVILEAEEKETPKEEPQYSQSQLDAHGKEKEQQARNAALADIGRLTKESERSLKAATAAGERTKKLLREMEDMETEAAQGNSGQRSEQEVKQMQLRRQVQTELTDVQLELDGKNERLAQLEADKVESTKGQTARDIAARLGIDVDRLVRLSKFTDGSTEAIEELAKELPKKEVRPPIITDSNQGGGGGGDDATFLKDYGEGNLPYNKENKERAERLIK